MTFCSINNRLYVFSGTGIIKPKPPSNVAVYAKLKFWQVSVGCHSLTKHCNVSTIGTAHVPFLLPQFAQFAFDSEESGHRLPQMKIRFTQQSLPYNQFTENTPETRTKQTHHPTIPWPQAGTCKSSDFSPCPTSRNPCCRYRSCIRSRTLRKRANPKQDNWIRRQRCQAIDLLGTLTITYDTRPEIVATRLTDTRRRLKSNF